MERDLFGNPIVEPEPPPEPDMLYPDLVLMVRGGVRFEDLGLTPEILARMQTEGVLDAELKVVSPISQWAWSDELDEYDFAVERFFALRPA